MRCEGAGSRGVGITLRGLVHRWLGRVTPAPWNRRRRRLLATTERRAGHTFKQRLVITDPTGIA
jgi:hypothetical protein